jgi:hypothetical protein
MDIVSLTLPCGVLDLTLKSGDKFWNNVSDIMESSFAFPPTDAALFGDVQEMAADRGLNSEDTLC